MNSGAKIALKKKIDKWYNVDQEVYLSVFDLAKERLEDILAESESITNKSIKITTGLLAFVGVFAGYFSANQNLITNFTPLLAWSGLPIFVNILTLVWLIFPKQTANKGLPPLIALVDDFDNPDDKENQMQLLYFNSIVVIQDNIDFMISKNELRAKFYSVSLILFLALIIYIPAITVYIISSRS
jgi:hypothetical protein